MMLIPRSTAALVFLALSACSPFAERAVVPEVWLATAPPVDRPDAGPCAATLVAAAVTATPGCWVDEKVANQTTSLTYACAGGAAVAPFDVDFVGSVSTDGRVDLGATSDFEWDDGCRWRSEQRIVGALSAGTLDYSYTEKPIAGEGCASAHCTASAQVAVQPGR
jgi:hypothetical protein